MKSYENHEETYFIHSAWALGPAHRGSKHCGVSNRDAESHGGYHKVRGFTVVCTRVNLSFKFIFHELFLVLLCVREGEVMALDLMCPGLPSRGCAREQPSTV